MARPQKQTVDYFPHRCKPGKTLFILEQRYGDKGYSFWFKTLELLGSTEGHAYYFDKAEDGEYLLSYTRTSREQALEILDLLSTLDAIDKELWQNNHIIWSDNFVDGVKDVYRYRTVDMPDKPVSDKENLLSVGISDKENPQSKVKYSKVKKSKEYVFNLPEWIDKDLWEDYIDMRVKIKKPATERAKCELVVDLEKLRSAGDDPGEVIKQSIKNSWSGLFPLHRNGKGNHLANTKELGDAWKIG